MNRRRLSVLYCILVDAFINEFKTAVIFEDWDLLSLGLQGTPVKTD